MTQPNYKRALAEIENIGKNEVVFVTDLRRVIEALATQDEKAIEGIEFKAIHQLQYVELINKMTSIAQRLNEIESIIGGTKRKWRDDTDRRLDVLEKQFNNKFTIEDKDAGIKEVYNKYKHLDVFLSKTRDIPSFDYDLWLAIKTYCGDGK